MSEDLGTRCTEYVSWKYLQDITVNKRLNVPPHDDAKRLTDSNVCDTDIGTKGFQIISSVTVPF